MGKKPTTASATERAYGRITLSDLTDARVAQWSVRAVAGEHRQFTRAAPVTELAVADAAAVARLAVQTIHDGTQKLIGLRCGTCEIAAFDALQGQHAHFKSDWHCLNLKRKGKGLAIFASEEDALEYLENSKANKKKSGGSSEQKESGDGYASSSSSASSSGASDVGDVDDVYTTAEPVVEYSDGKSVFKVYKNILPRFDDESFDPYTSLDEIRASKFKWAVFLLRSGRFAGAIFEKEKAVCHKTFQRYTVRRKQGGSQSANDASGGKAKSAGATLRRYNEAALKQDVADLLVQWKDLLQSTDLIFISSGKTDRTSFFGGKTPVLQPDDKRLRRIPFATFRPTFEELCRVRSDLSSVRFSPLPAEPSPSSSDNKAKRQSDQGGKMGDQLAAVVEEVEAEEPEVFPPVIELVLDGELSKLKELDLTPVEGNTSTGVNALDSNFMTALHHAAAKDSVAMVGYLLESGANPSLLDLRSRPPYLLCSTKETRNAFRRFLADHPNAWDYAASQIPTALTSEMEQKKKEKEAEKRRRAKERKKQQKKDANEAQEQELARKEEEERQAALGKACDMCGKYAGKTPFLRLEYKYCSTDCVNAHKRKLMSEAALRRFGN
ncbi:Ankyrin repeat protein [Globisporangium polare]